MHRLGLNEIREQYLAFFESKGHLRLPSFSLVPHGDPSLLLINAGMTPMKPYFAGTETPPSRRVTTCQKCIRTPDIEEVGHTDRHGTYFEMLGNFSFGDYFKKEAIAWAWEFSTDVLGMEPERIHVTVFEEDDEAYAIWRDEAGLPEERIYRGGKEDNFWEHGTGACGPCSELFYDRGEAYGCGKADCGPFCGCDRFMEYWNLVFTQFDRQEDGSYLPLKNKNIDTGAGLERIATLSQGVKNLFEVDTVRAVLDKVCSIAGLTYGQAHKDDVAIRVITDHIRSTTMMIADGIVPGNEGRGYVLRRLLRRASRYGRLLGIERQFLNELTPIVIQESAGAYPELKERESFIKTIIDHEEASFHRTISQGSALLDEAVAAARQEGRGSISGEEAFRLHDTYGFPLDLTREIAAEHDLTVDEDGFNERMAEQKAKAKAASLARNESAWGGSALPGETLALPATVFTGYDHLRDTGQVLMLLVNDEAGQAAAREEAGAGEALILILDRTPAYAQSGGQVGDTGVIEAEGLRLRFTDTSKTAGGLYLHHCTVEEGLVRRGQAVTVTVDRDRRSNTARNHTATHLLHKALREVLGEHVTQAGSEVSPERLRFDFTHFQAMTTDELGQVETLVNEAILRDYDVVTTITSQEAARAEGAIALFDETYGDEVRVITVQESVNGELNVFSKELCGGTHLKHTSQAAAFAVLSESSVASGIRRIEAVTGRAAIDLARANQALLDELAAQLKTRPAELASKVGQMQEDLRQQGRTIKDLEGRLTQGAAASLIDQAEEVGGIKCLIARTEASGMDTLRDLAAGFRDKLGASVVLLGAEIDGKVNFIAMASPEAVEAGANSGKLIKAAAQAAGGGGGGRADMAQAGAKDLSRLDEALEAARTAAREMLG